MTADQTQAPAEGDAAHQPSVLLDGQTPHEFVLGELHEWQQATGFDTAAEFLAFKVQPKGTLTREEARRYCAAGFQEWLDDSVADGGTTVFDLLTSVHDAYSGFQAAGSYAPVPEALPHPGSPEADKMLDTLLAEYGYPANMKNAARAGYMAARRLIGWARKPLPDVQAPPPRLHRRRPSKT